MIIKMNKKKSEGIFFNCQKAKMEDHSFTISQISPQESAVSLDDLRVSFFYNFDSITKKKLTIVGEKRTYAQSTIESPPNDPPTGLKNVFSTVIDDESIHIARFPWFFKLEFKHPGTATDKPSISLTWSKLFSGTEEGTCFKLGGTADNLKFPFSKDHFISEVTSLIYSMCKYNVIKEV